MQIGIDTFVGTRQPGPPGDVQRVQELLTEIERADQVGLDVVGIGEHHRPDYLASSPATLLAAAAARTKQIRLASAVTVLSSDDPVRVFQQFATVDLISNGRAEIVMAGAPSSSPTRSSATTCTTTTSSPRRSWNCSSRSGRRPRSRGKAGTGRP